MGNIVVAYIGVSEICRYVGMWTMGYDITITIARLFSVEE